MPLDLHHGPEKDVHRFPGFLTMFAYDKAVDSVDSRKTGESYTLATSQARPNQLINLYGLQFKGTKGLTARPKPAETGSSVLKAGNLVRFDTVGVLVAPGRDCPA